MSHGAGGYINGVVSDNKTPSPSQPPGHAPKRRPVNRRPVGGTDSNSTTPTTSPNPQTGSPLLGPPIVPYGAASVSGGPSAAPGVPPAANQKPYRYSSLFDPESTSPKPATTERRAVSEARKVTPLQTTSAGGSTGGINFSKPVSPASQHTNPGGFGRAQTAQTASQAPSLPPKVPVTSTHNPYAVTPETKQGAFGYQASQFASPAAAGPYATNGSSPQHYGAAGKQYSPVTRPPVPTTSAAPSTPKNTGSAGGSVPGSAQSPPYPVPTSTTPYGASNTGRHTSNASVATASTASSLPYPVPVASQPAPETPPLQSAYQFESPDVMPKVVPKPAVSKPAMPPVPKTTYNSGSPAMPPIPKTNIQKPAAPVAPQPVAPVPTKAPAPAPAPAPVPVQAAPVYQPSHHLPPRSPSPDSEYQHSPPRRTLRVVNDFSSSSEDEDSTPASSAPQAVPTVVKTPAGPRDYPLSNRMSNLEINDGNHLDPFTPAAPLRIHKKSPSATSNPSFDFATRESFYATPSGSADDISQEYVTNESYHNSQRGLDNNRSMSSMFTGHQSYDSGSSHSTRPMSGGEDMLAGHHLAPQYTHESAIDPFDPSFDPHNPAYEPRSSYNDPPSPETPAVSEGPSFDAAAFGGGAIIGGSVVPVLLDPSVNIPDPTEYGAFDVGAPLVPSVTNMSTGTTTSIPGLRGAPSIISTTSQISQKGITNSDYPALGVESQYVRALRKRTASAWCEVPSKVWGLPLGISDKAGKKSNKNMDMRYAAGLKRTMDIRHSHLKPRLLASEVDDDDGKRSSSHVDMPSSIHAPSIHSMSRYDNRSIISHDDDVDGRSSVSLVSAPQESTPPPVVSTPRPRAPSNSSQESVQEVRRIHLFVANPDSD